MNRKIRILTVSSANMDFVMNVRRLPAAGETMSESGSYSFVPGGKGANSAVAVQRLGGESVFCARLGNDANGNALKNLYIAEGIDTRFIVMDGKLPTGLAAIFVEPSGQNRIIVYPGSNTGLTERDITASMMCRPDALLMQTEIAAVTVLAAARHAASRGKPVLLDAGPADPDFPLEELPPLELFSPNEQETLVYSGIDPSNPQNCLRACMRLSERVRARFIVLKLGGRGCYIYDGKYYHCLPTYDVPCEDTTGAGDTFTAALTLEYLRTGDIVHAGKYANAAASISVSRAGAMPSIPTAEEVAAFVSYNGVEL